jgi:hypothetical protein
MPGVAWLVIGVCVTALVLPSTAYALGALKFQGIEGANLNKANVTASGQLNTNGVIQGASGNQADVTPAGQVLATSANPASAFLVSNGNGGPNAYTQLYSPPAGFAAVITSMHVSSYSLSGTDPYMLVGTNNVGCGSLMANIDEVDPGSDGVTVLPYDPGYVLPYGYYLCLHTVSMGAEVTVNGYLIPSAAAPSAPQAPRATSSR